MENHFLDPFKIFGISYSFDVENLDYIYFEKYKKNQNLEDLNLAYKILKDPLQKLLFLCEFHGKNVSDPSILSSIFNLIKNKNELAQLANKNFSNAIKFARRKDWNNCWIEMQKYQYLKKMI